MGLLSTQQVVRFVSLWCVVHDEVVWHVILPNDSYDILAHQVLHSVVACTSSSAIGDMCSPIGDCVCD